MAMSTDGRYNFECCQDSEVTNIKVDIRYEGCLVTSVPNVTLFLSSSPGEIIRAILNACPDAPPEMTREPEQCALLYVDTKTRLEVVSNSDLVPFSEGLFGEESHLEIVMPRSDSYQSPTPNLQQFAVQRK